MNPERFAAFGDEALTVATNEDVRAEQDSLRDILTERILDGQNIDDIITELINLERYELLRELLVKLLTIISDSTTPQLEIAVLVEAAGLPLQQGTSHTELAKRYGITRAAFSARIQTTLKKLGLNPPRGCKSEPSRATYRLTNTRKHKVN